MKKVFWCIGGGVMQQPLIHEVHQLGYDVLVTDGSESCVCSQSADIFFCIDIFDVDGHIELAAKLRNEYEIVGVLAAGIDAPITMSRVAEHLGLPGVPSAISETVHFKSKFRNFCVKHNIEVPEYKVFHECEIDTLTTYLDDIPTPFIIKNVDSSGSRGTKIFYRRDQEEELRIAREAITFSKSNSFLVESVWEGQECTVETLFDINGNFHKCFITDRIFDYSTGYPIEQSLIHPSRLSVHAQEECFALAKAVSDKLGIKIGAAKFDMIYTNSGPKIIEMTTRLSGGFDCQYVVPAATGKNILKAAILTACGQEFSPACLLDAKNMYAVTKSHWPKNGKIIDISGIEEARKLDGIEQIFFRKAVGDRVAGFENCVDRVSFVIATGDTLDEAEKNAQTAIDMIKVSVTE